MYKMILLSSISHQRTHLMHQSLSLFAPLGALNFHDDFAYYLHFPFFRSLPPLTLPLLSFSRVRSLARQSHARKLDAFLVREAVGAVKPRVSDSHIGAVNVTVGNWRLTHATFEAVDVIEETQIFDNHRRTAAQLAIAVRADFLARHAQHI